MATNPAPRPAPAQRLQPGGKVGVEKLNQWWREGKQQHEPIKRRWKRMRDFYYGEQWDAKNKQALEAENRAALVHNFVAPTLNLVIGTERRNRLDPRAYGRGPGDVERALIGTKVIKFVKDQTNAAIAGSAAFEDAAISGLGVTRIEIQEDDPDQDQILYEKVDVMRFYWDLRAKRWDKSDAAWMFEEGWYLGEELAAAFSGKQKEIEDLLTGPEEPLTGNTDVADQPNGDGSWGHYGNVSTWEMDSKNWIDSADRLIRVVSMYYMRREPVQMLVARGERSGPEFDPANLEHLQKQIERDPMTGEFLYQVVKKRRRVVYKALFSGKTVFWHDKLPYEHRQYPYVFRVWLTKDNGEHVGLTGNLLDPQDELNKQLSKALDLLVSEQALVEEGAVKDLAAFAKALADPRGVAQVRPGALKRGAIQLRDQAGRVEKHVNLANILISEIQSVAGTPRERLGGGPGQAASAVALKIEQGDLQTAFGFDNLRLAVEREGEIILSLAQQFYPPGTWIRITEDPRAPEYIQLGDPESPGADIYQGRFDVKVDAQAATATFRQAIFQQMLEVANNKGLPLPVVLLCLKTAFDNSDIPDRQAMVGTLDTMFQAALAGVMLPPNLPALGGAETGDALPGAPMPGSPMDVVMPGGGQ